MLLLYTSNEPSEKEFKKTISSTTASKRISINKFNQGGERCMPWNNKILMKETEDKTN